MKQKPIRNYLDWEDLIKQSGYKTRTPKIGSFGAALIKATKEEKNQGRLTGWLRKQLGSFFNKQKKHNQKDKDERKK